MARLAILSYSDGRFDARGRRIARSAAAAGHDVVMYARWAPGLPVEEVDGGIRIVRVPVVLRMAVPGLRWSGRRRLAGLRRSAAAVTGPPVSPLSDVGHAVSSPRRRIVPPAAARIARLPGVRFVRELIGPAVHFPLRPLAWAAALEETAAPAELWHGMWAGSLPALARLRRRHGGRTVYDSRDIYLHARVFARLPAILRRPYRALERRWASDAALVVTVNDAYADLLGPWLGVARPLVVRNCPDPIAATAGSGDVIRAAIGLPTTTPVVLYQGGFLTDRGIERSIVAIGQVPGAHLVLLGFGPLRATLDELIRAPGVAGRVTILDPVPPEELVAWTASADVALIPIQPTSPNHRYSTPQKLWEAIAAGVPVVASDLPGMAAVVREIGAGELCDPTEPAAIAAAIRALLDQPRAERARMRERILAAARDRYRWDVQVAPLLAAYDRLLEHDRLLDPERT